MPQATPTPVPPTAAATDNGAVIPATAVIAASPVIPASSASPATAESGALTLGDLAARVDTAWPDVTSYRVTFTGATTPAASAPGTPVTRPAATPGATPVARQRETVVSEREVVLPDRQRQVVTGLGDDDHEAISIRDALFVRGPVVTRIAPGTAPDDWIELDPSALPAGALLSQLLGGLPGMPPAPLASLPDRLRPQAVRALGTVTHDGRECRVYGAADTVAATGMRVDYTIAIDEDDIPCFIETGAGGVVQGRDEYSGIDASFTIEAPESATPVSIPPALATPVARD